MSMMPNTGAQAPASSLTGPNNSFSSAGGSQFFNQIPQQRTGVVLVQTPIPASGWTQVMTLPRNPYVTIQDFWIYNIGASAMDCYFAMAARGSAFSSSGGTTQVDVFQICSGVSKVFRETNSFVSLNPKQALWFYSTQACNLRLSGLQVNL